MSHFFLLTDKLLDSAKAPEQLVFQESTTSSLTTSASSSEASLKLLQSDASPLTSQSPLRNRSFCAYTFAFSYALLNMRDLEQEQESQQNTILEMYVETMRMDKTDKRKVTLLKCASAMKSEDEALIEQLVHDDEIGATTDDKDLARPLLTPNENKEIEEQDVAPAANAVEEAPEAEVMLTEAIIENKRAQLSKRKHRRVRRRVARKNIRREKKLKEVWMRRAKQYLKQSRNYDCTLYSK